MGQGITIECKSCNYSKTFTLGVGIMYSSLENVINLVSKAMRDKVLDILQNEDVHTVDYQHKLFVCPHCHNLESHFDFLIQYNDDKECAPQFRCSKCQRKLTPVNEPIETLHCPKCGRKTLSQSVSMMWD